MNLLNNSISFVIPCYNEQNNIENVVKEIISSLKNTVIVNYEVIIVNDGSKDNSLNVLSEIEKKYGKIKIINKIINEGIGSAIKSGFLESQYERMMYLPGDNSHKDTEIKKMINSDPKYDFILTYYENPGVRSFFRNIFTKLYTPFLNIIFGLNIPYYNGTNIYKKSIIKNININTNSFTWQIELILKMFKTKNINYLVIPTRLEDRIIGKSKAFNLRNSIYVVFSILKLFLLQFILTKKK